MRDEVCGLQCVSLCVKKIVCRLNLSWRSTGSELERGRGKANRVKGAKDATVGQSKQTRGNAHFIRSLHFKGTKIYTKLGQIGIIWAENDELPYLAFHEVV